MFGKQRKQKDPPQEDDSPQQVEAQKIAYEKGYSDALNEILQEVEQKGKAQRFSKGFNELNFSFGVLNCFIVAVVFSAYPQHFWLLYVLESVILFPLKVSYLMSLRPLNGIYYLLDYCWIMNFTAVLVIMFLVVFNVPDDIHEELFGAAFGAACGPLLGATATLNFIVLVFHDHNEMLSVFIHIFPPMVLYTMKWENEKIREAWPEIFDLDYDIEFDMIYRNSMILYFIWFIPYTIWFLREGLDLPLQQYTSLDDSSEVFAYDTNFHYNMRANFCYSAGKIWNRPVEESKKMIEKNQFEKRDLAAYLGFHFILAFSAITFLAYPCYLSKYYHGGLLILVLIICTYRGAGRYTYYVTKMYTRLVRSHMSASSKSPSSQMESMSEGAPLLP